MTVTARLKVCNYLRMKIGIASLSRCRLNRAGLKKYEGKKVCFTNVIPSARSDLQTRTSASCVWLGPEVGGARRRKWSNLSPTSSTWNLKVTSAVYPISKLCVTLLKKPCCFPLHKNSWLLSIVIRWVAPREESEPQSLDALQKSCIKPQNSREGRGPNEPHCCTRAVWEHTVEM